MIKSKVPGALVLAVSMSYATCSFAFELSGRWASDPSICSKLFVTKGKSTSVRKGFDAPGSGFIIDGKLIKGQLASCNIKTTKQDGAVIHLIAACATDVMLSDVQLSLKVVDDNKIQRTFPGMEGMEIPFYRCTAGPSSR